MKKILIYTILIILLLSICPSTQASQILENTIVVTSTEPNEQSTETTDNLTIYSDCILMIEKETGDILYEKNAYEKMYPASTTKMLTAIIVLETCDLDEVATVSATALKAVPTSYTTANLQEGEELRVEDLLYAMLIPSANDAANVLAEHVAGSIEAFAEIMNEKSTEIGCTASHFTNPSGVHDENLYTTAYDLALIARYAMSIEKFREIVTTVTYTLPSTNVYPNADRTFTISNALLKTEYKDYYYEYATGVKTGYTNAAKDCLVASAKKDDVEFIIVTLGDGYTESGLRQKYVDCKTLFNFAFDNYITYYQELQAQKEEENQLISEEQEQEIQEIQDEEEEYNIDKILKILSKIIAVIVILVAIKLLFGKRKRRKKKNRYRYGKHSKKI